ncbi:PD-(D/E)XK nuclease superfamily protein [Succinivibrio dextrinosolvens DSM 3072]|uniref:PD-(D/E)XK nuclease superfamily protein n=1 Tax=Succinivibrio dextrinosolvens DSM 3072 TaxID=1123324 RepID=A0A1T4VNN9_9GAMM|nr:AAA family ATPase [Succinivibrio dextrinosolvens]SKA66580.1 PD-(D/E)XK nuclease superfamily protein [Succinivibrio dextrinosolvens DSM 3072]
MVDISRLPRAKNKFEDIRKKNQIYVDHTDLIYEFAYLDGPNFLSRPRRFGKSLLVSTLESLFSHGTEFFKGLKIEKLWDEKEKGKIYRVIHLDFSNMTYTSTEEFDRKIYDELNKTAKALNVTPSEVSSKYIAESLFKDIILSAPGEFVLLIDEYDYPLTHSLDNKSLFEEYRNYLQGFFGAIKGLTGDMRFVFITGVGRFAKTSVFSQLNNLRDLGLESDFAPLLGYTDDDMHQYFDEYVENAANTLNISKEECYSQIKAHYDGYRFHVDNAATLYNPWSVLNFLTTPKNGFRNFWYETGGAYPTLIASYIKNIQKTPLETLLKTKCGPKTLNEFYDYFDATPLSLLYQTGYLTVRSEPNEMGGQSLFLVPPNLEVHSSLIQLYYRNVRKNSLDDDVFYEFASALINNFEKSDYNSLIKTFSAALNTFGYDDNEAFKSEHYCRDIVYFTLTLSGINAQREVIEANGRADLTVELTDKRYVFEFKLAQDSASENRLLEEAVSQIKDRHYGEILPLKKLIRIAVVISAKNKAVSQWQIIE